MNIKLLLKKPIIKWIIGIAIFEALSFLLTFHPSANTCVALLAGFFLFLVTTRSPIFGIAIVSVEYIIGSHGALLYAFGDDLNHGGVSLRIIFFSAFILGWLFRLYRYRSFSVRRFLCEYWLYIGVALLFFFALTVGWLTQNHSLIFKDANAWPAFFLLIPFVNIASYESMLIDKMRAPIFSALVWLPIKTLTLFYFFSHKLAFINDYFYLWVRRTGVGEITAFNEFAHRLFFQSHIYAVIVIIGCSAWKLSGRKWNVSGNILFILSFSELIISLSRSFALGLVIGLLTLLILMIGVKVRAMIIAKTAITFCVGILASMLLVWSISSVSWSTSHLFGFQKILSDRTTIQDPASSSRMASLPILWNKIKEHPLRGSGFGSTITYESQDPRAKEHGGQVTVYAVEWGWLEFWEKFGILGIPFFLILLVWIGIRFWRDISIQWLRWTGISSLIALATIHFFTPYLNHPLGFFILISTEVIRENMKKKRPPDQSEGQADYGVCEVKRA